ncbi:MAG: hypothetical protein QM731_10355 [Chitinophagaceae bacterium]
MTREHEVRWQSLLPQEVMKLFEQVDFPWWIAGGYAIDHFVGRPVRTHDNINVLVMRKDLQQIRESLTGWDCRAVDRSGFLIPWSEGEALTDTTRVVWCREQQESPWQLQLMLDEGNSDNWYSRRCEAVTKPVGELGVFDNSGIPFLVPEVQLFYKSKSPREKDEMDFDAALPLMDAPQRAWLSDAIIAAYGKTNKWLAHMTLLFI